jgi:integral membrane protein (TIGR01906 family)
VKIFNFISKWLFVVCLPPLLLSTSIGLAFNSLWIYRYSLEKYNAVQVTGLSNAELEKAARGLISYFNSREEFIDLNVEKDGSTIQLFNEREIVHLKDVKALVWLDYKILLGALLYVLAYAGVSIFRRQHWRSLVLSVLIGSGITLFLMLALGMGVLFDFDSLLLQFHLISFSNDYWQLYPGDYLLLFFPGFEAALFVTVSTTVMAVILGGAAGGYLRFNKNKT